MAHEETTELAEQEQVGADLPGQDSPPETPQPDAEPEVEPEDGAQPEPEAEQPAAAAPTDADPEWDLYEPPPVVAPAPKAPPAPAPSLTQPETPDPVAALVERLVPALAERLGIAPRAPAPSPAPDPDIPAPEIDPNDPYAVHLARIEQRVAQTAKALEQKVEPLVKQSEEANRARAQEQFEAWAGAADKAIAESRIYSKYQSDPDRARFVNICRVMMREKQIETVRRFKREPTPEEARQVIAEVEGLVRPVAQAAYERAIKRTTGGKPVPVMRGGAGSPGAGGGKVPPSPNGTNGVPFGGDHEAYRKWFRAGMKAQQTREAGRRG